MADYPTGIYTPRTIENLPGIVYDATKETHFYAEDLNNTNAEIIAIEETLGENPQGIYTTVKEWLEWITANMSTGAVWGAITGTLSDQTDLQSALNAKQNSLGFTPEDVSNKKTTMSGNSASNTFYLSAKAVFDWATATFQAALGFTPENVANKSTTTTLGTSDTLYPSQKAVKTYVDTQIAGVSGLPTGAVALWGTSVAPTGFILCDGASLLRSGTYAALFAIIGTTFGSADGTHFNVPDLQQRVPVGYKSGDSDFGTLGQTGGEKTHTLTTNEMPSHNHGMILPQFGGSSTYQAAFSGNAGTNTTAMLNAGGGAAHNNIQPYIVLNYIIKI